MRSRLSILLLILLAFSFKKGLAQNDSLDYLLIYYMPYDNNLSVYGSEIIDELVKGSSENVGIVIQADFEDTLGHQRISIINGQVDTTRIENESSDIGLFIDYMDWVSSEYSFRNYALFFLDHGADLSHIGIDEYPNRQYYDITEIAETIETFNIVVQQKASLLFLQQCSRSSIEIVYEFRDCADYTLASQIELGAPNSYYHETLNMISEHPNLNGEELGKTIAHYESYDMYHSYSLINNSTLDQFVLQLSLYFSQLKKNKLTDSEVLMESYFGETYWDLYSLLSALNISNDEFQLLNDGTIQHLTNPRSTFIESYCGLSLFSPYNTTIKEHNGLQLFDYIDYKKLRKRIKISVDPDYEPVKEELDFK